MIRILSGSISGRLSEVEISSIVNRGRMGQETTKILEKSEQSCKINGDRADVTNPRIQLGQIEGQSRGHQGNSPHSNRTYRTQQLA